MNIKQFLVLMLLLGLAEPIALQTGHWLGIVAFAPFVAVYMWYISKNHRG